MAMLLPLLLTLGMLPRTITSTVHFQNRLIMDRDTLPFYEMPLERLTGNDSLQFHAFIDKAKCWFGYMAYWTIRKKQLYLTDIYSACYEDNCIKADLKEMFGSKFVNGKVKMDGFDGSIMAQKGKLIGIYGERSIYEKELKMDFRNGVLSGTEILDNSKTRFSRYYQDHKALVQFIYSNIRWENLPEMKSEGVRVIASFSANEKGKIDSVRILKGADEVFNREAVRVIKEIPEWDIIYMHGKQYKMPWHLPILFNIEAKTKFAPKASRK